MLFEGVPNLATFLLVSCINLSHCFVGAPPTDGRVGPETKNTQTRKPLRKSKPLNIQKQCCSHSTQKPQAQQNP